MIGDRLGQLLQPLRPNSGTGLLLFVRCGFDFLAHITELLRQVGELFLRVRRRLLGDIPQLLRDVVELLLALLHRLLRLLLALAIHLGESPLQILRGSGGRFAGGEFVGLVEFVHRLGGMLFGLFQRAHHRRWQHVIAIEENLDTLQHAGLPLNKGSFARIRTEGIDRLPRRQRNHLLRICARGSIGARSRSRCAGGGGWRSRRRSFRCWRGGRVIEVIRQLGLVLDQLFQLPGRDLHSLPQLMLLLVLEGIFRIASGRRCALLCHDLAEKFLHFHDETQSLLLRGERFVVLGGEDFLGCVIHRRFGLAQEINDLGGRTFRDESLHDFLRLC